MSKLLEIVEVPPRLFAIGDIHGCEQELAVLLEHLVSSESLSSKDQVIFIGDYIDRGENARLVVDHLLTFQKSYENAIFLKGNHEDMLLDFFGYGGSSGRVWVQNGGAATLASYGVDPSGGIEGALQSIPREHISFYLNLESYCLVGEFLFAHAGINPLRDLRSQLDRDLFWIRDEFINNTHSLSKTVVFGHTPHQDVFFHWPFKIGIDTGLVFGNKLTCIELIGHKVLQIERGSKSVSIRNYPAPPKS